MNRTAVNLGAGGFVSYYEDGGATVILDPYLGDNQGFSEEPVYAEQGFGAYIADRVYSDPPEGTEGIPLPLSAAAMNGIRNSGRTGAEDREVYYPEGPTFFETLASEYNYPTEKMSGGVRGIDLVGGATRHQRPRHDLPTPQELEDVRAHMLGSAIMARGYGPETAKKVGDLGEFFFGNRDHSIMDKRNNAVGISLFKKAGIESTPAQLTEMVDKRIFQQLNVILGRKPEEQGPPSDKPQWTKNFRSPTDGPDLYFPRDNSGYFLPDKK